MIEDYYSNMQFAVWVLLLLTGSYLLNGKVPDKPVFNTYRKSRKIMGGAFLVYFVQFFIQWVISARDNYPLVASALNVTLFYLATIMVSFSFISLLNEKYLKRRRIVVHLSIWGIMNSAIWLSVAFLPHNVSLWVLIFAAVWFFVYVAHLSLVFFKTYLSAAQKIQNYHSDEVDGFIRWISKSVFFAIIMGLLCSAMAFAPKWIITIYLTSSIPFFYYIFVSFLDYLIHYETVDDAIKDMDEPETETPNNPVDKILVYKQVEKKLQEWIEEKGYLCPKINMGDLARLIGSNRSYLSSYINTQYSCTYYEWIARLRMEDAKKLLVNQPELTIVQVAERAGFSSNSHFTTLFTEKENISPAKWREMHI
ncbi:MAG: helix-turn-helix domain-containing protein [Muribaculaceae bacterium]